MATTLQSLLLLSLSVGMGSGYPDYEDNLIIGFHFLISVSDHFHLEFFGADIVSFHGSLRLRVLSISFLQAVSVSFHNSCMLCVFHSIIPLG